MLVIVLLTCQSHTRGQRQILFSVLKGWLVSLKCHTHGDLLICVSASILNRVTARDTFSAVFILEEQSRFPASG